MPHPFSRYRLRFANDILRIFVWPTGAFYLFTAVTRAPLGLLTIPGWAAFVFAAAWLRDIYAQWYNSQLAAQMGAKLPPTVRGKWPGNIDMLFKMRRATADQYLCQFYLDLFEKYRSTTVNLRILGSDLLITMDEEHIKHILATGFNQFWRGRRQKERMETFLGDGIFNRDDDQWKLHRAMARPFFARDRISDFALFERYTEPTLSILSSKASSYEAVEIQDLYSRFTLDTAAEALFGENLDTLHGALPIPGQSCMSAKGSATNDEFGSFAQAFETSQEIIVGRTLKGYFWPATQLVKDDLEPQAKVIEKWLQPMITRVLSHRNDLRKAGMTSPIEESTFLDYLAEHTEDPKTIHDQLLNVLLAGRDTTSCLLTYVTYLMALHPDVTQRLRAEVLKVVGPTNSPTFDHIKQLRYLHAVINETLRLFPPVPQNQRECRDQPALFPKSDRTYPDNSDVPIYVPPRTPVLYATMLTHRNTALWGPDADKFDPERWLDDRLSIYTDNPMMFTPFSAGPRICIGQNYARNEASYFLVRLLQRFDTFTLAPEFQPEGSRPPPEWRNTGGRASTEQLRPAFALTLFVKGGLWMRFGKAQDS